MILVFFILCYVEVLKLQSVTHVHVITWVWTFDLRKTMEHKSDKTLELKYEHSDGATPEKYIKLRCSNVSTWLN